MNDTKHTSPGADTANAWPDGPVPYTLTREAESLLGSATGNQPQPARDGWMLTPKADALLDTQAEAEA